MQKAILILEDGFCLEGNNFGAEGETFGEIVFNTSMSGYQEILTDPSYKGQIVTMTYPLIGNYGVNLEDVEHSHPWAEGFVVKELSALSSNWRNTEDLDSYLKRNNIVGIEGVDTRALTRHIRLEGAMRGAISTKTLDKNELLKKVHNSPKMEGRDLVKEVSCAKEFIWQGEALKFNDLEYVELPKKKQFKVVAVDCGAKYNIFRMLSRVGCDVTIVPSIAKAKTILAMHPDGVFLSNGPGDPAVLGYIINEVKQMIGNVPIFGICLGHQLLGHAFGGKTFKLKFGHHGANHPVMDLETQKVEITAQNHGFAVDMDSIPDKDVILTHINLYDKTVEGLRHKKLPIFSVQYHPEASPGPHDASYLFNRFVEMMEKQRS